MKIVGKILLVAFVTFYSLPSPLVAMASEDLPISPAVKGTRAVNGYICVSDEQPSYPHHDNPYKTYHTTLSDCFLEQHNNPSYQFPTSEDNLIELGEYRIDRGMHLGSGDDGYVYLARHISTGIYAAAKSREMVYGREEYHDEYKRLTVLGQLYAAWIKEKKANEVNDYRDASKFKIFVYGYCCNYILGTKKYFNDLKEGGEIVEPWPIVNFLRAINTNHWDLTLDTFLKALETLEDEISN
ncbi:MAG: hypothetical protein K2X28_05250 [Alphaproteobacteria bacterium]|nr:hypothetical protein [Alphaproteobacteria bacterium]